MSDRELKNKIPRGRPTELTYEIIEKICSILRTGNYPYTAFKMCGIPATTYYRWVKRGKAEKVRVETYIGTKVRKKEKIYVDLVDMTEQAIAEGEVRAVAIISKAAVDDWKAASFILERRYAERWKKKESSEIELNGKYEVEQRKYDEKIKSNPELQEITKTLYRKLNNEEEGEGSSDTELSEE